jgi:hypothetical protein
VGERDAADRAMSNGQWAMDVGSLRLLDERLAGLKPALSLECGSGASTGVLRRHSGWVVSLEHLPEQAANLSKLDIPGEVRIVPPVDGFYRTQPPDGIDFALIDGPVARLHGRFGTLPGLWRHLSPGAVVWIDDFDRKHEQECIAQWARTYHFDIERVDAFVAEIRPSW